MRKKCTEHRTSLSEVCRSPVWLGDMRRPPARPARGFSRETGRCPWARRVDGGPAACRHFGWEPRRLWPWREGGAAGQLVARSQGGWLSDLPEAPSPKDRWGRTPCRGGGPGKGFPQAPAWRGKGCHRRRLPSPPTRPPSPPHAPGSSEAQAPLLCSDAHRGDRWYEDASASSPSGPTESPDPTGRVPARWFRTLGAPGASPRLRQPRPAPQGCCSPRAAGTQSPN